MAQHKGGKKNRKFGRNVRSPAMKRYNAENRAAVNKAKKQRRHQKRVAKKEVTG